MYFKCAHRAPASDTNTTPMVRNGSKSLTVDIHCHRECDEASEMMKEEAKRVGFAALSFGSDLTKDVNKKQLEFIRPKMESLDERLADMDRMGVDIQAISVSPYQFYYWAEPEPGRAAARMINDSIAGAVAEHPDRFVGLGSVPLQNTEMAVAELERCVKDLGLRGVEIHSRVGDDELSAPGAVFRQGRRARHPDLYPHRRLFPHGPPDRALFPQHHRPSYGSDYGAQPSHI